MPGVPGNVVHGEWGGGMGTTCLLRQHSGHGARIRGVGRTVCGKIKMKCGTVIVPHFFLRTANYPRHIPRVLQALCVLVRRWASRKRLHDALDWLKGPLWRMLGQVLRKNVPLCK